jgi:hypothetical protein
VQGLAGASLLGLVVPGAALSVLGPLVLAGLLGLGLAHGACDQLVLPAVGLVRGSKVAAPKCLMGILPRSVRLGPVFPRPTAPYAANRRGPSRQS